MAKKTRAEENKYEKFSVERISRAEIKGADYNPRKIGEEARRKLKKSLKEHGLVMPIVVNRRTMTIVSGHQRVSLLDDIIRKNDYPLTCAFYVSCQAGFAIFLSKNQIAQPLPARLRA